MSVDRILERDRELRAHATPRPWHQDGPRTRSRLVGPLPRSTVVVDPYGPNPQDAPLILHRVNSYERLEEEIERLRAALRELRAELEATRRLAVERPSHEVLESLTRDLRARIAAALGERRVDVAASPAPRAPAREAARIPDTRT